MVDNVIIMAGGAGKRLWPASIQKKPKQFLSVDGSDSLIIKTIIRAVNLNISGKILIVTHQDHAEMALMECESLPGHVKEKVVIIPEPIARNTAPALALAAAYLKNTGQEKSTVLVLAADHLITPQEKFTECAEKASLAAKENRLVTFGIVPTGPETGYGYVEAGKEKANSREVISFKEKPDQKTAEEFIAAGNFYWNSGMFVFPVDFFFSELEKYSPEIAAPFKAFTSDVLPEEQREGVTLISITPHFRETYENLKGDSIDYALMEKSSARDVVAADFQWNDVGSWDVIADTQPKQGEIADIEGKNNYVFSEIPVGLYGVEDLIVVIQNGKALVCKKGDSQGVKQIVEQLGNE